MPCTALFLPILPNIQAPQMGSKRAAGWDLCCCDPFTLPADQKALIVETGWLVGLSGCGNCNVRLESRSGLALSHNVVVKNTGALSLYARDPGPASANMLLFFDQCRGRIYRVTIVLINYGTKPLILPGGSRVAQLIVSHTKLRSIETVPQSQREFSTTFGSGSTVGALKQFKCELQPYNRSFIARVSTGDEPFYLPPLSNVLIDTQFVIPWLHCRQYSSYVEVYSSDIFALCFEHHHLIIFRGIIDSDYNDNVKVLLINSGKRAVKIPSHQDLAFLRLSEQVTMSPEAVCIWCPRRLASAIPSAGSAPPAERKGGFGSTGIKPK